MQYDFPDKKLANKSYTHDLEELLEAAQLKGKLENDRKLSKQFDAYWACVVEWDEKKRYELGVAEKEARDLWEAIADPKDGVLQWLKKLW